MAFKDKIQNLTVELNTNLSDIFELQESNSNSAKSNVGLIFLKKEGDMVHFSFLQDNDTII